MDEDAFMEKSCFDVGIGGGCGADCPVYQRGDCEEPPVPYVWICVDDTGVSLTEGGKYEVIEKRGKFFVVEDDEGEKKEFYASRFDLDEESLAE